MAEQSILKGHKQVGKRFIPPLKQLPGMTEVSFVNDLLPELIWLGLINDNLGFISGARFFEKIVSAATEVAGEPPYKNFALLSQLGALNSKQRKAFLRILSNTETIDPFRRYIAPLTLLYDECPIAFIGSPDVVCEKNELIKSIKDCVGRHVDKYDTPGVVLNGMMLLARLVAETISFPRELQVPDFNAVVAEPDSEEAKRAASFMRAHALAEYGALKISNTWACHFWNKNFEISKCEFDYESEG